MHRKIFTEQIKRGKRTAVYLCLLLMATAFFVMSVDLYYNSTSNLDISENAFSTLAVVELYGEVDQYGQLVERNSEDHIGYQAVGVEGYDFSDLIDSEAVESWDLRTYYGAYIADEPAMIYAPADLSDGTIREEWTMRSYTVIRFRIQSDNPIPLTYHPYSVNQWRERGFFALEVLDEAAGCYVYPDRLTYTDFGFTQEEWDAAAEDIRAFNRSDDTDRLILYPGVEYVAILRNHGYWLENEETGLWEYTDTRISESTFSLATPYQDYESIRLVYDPSGEGLEYEPGCTPFPLQRWEDVQSDPALKSYFEDLWQVLHVQQHTHNVVATSDVTSVPAFHLGIAALTEGRLITDDEYAQGTRVCLISDEVAKSQGWQVGDRVTMQLFESEYIPVGAVPVGGARYVHRQPIYSGGETPFVDEGEYEIVGIYSIYSTVGYTELAASTTEVSPYSIYIPASSIAADMDLSGALVNGSTLSIKLKNGSAGEFQADMDAKGLLTAQSGQYTPTFHFYDQGYSAVASSLRSMGSTARLLLLLSSILLLIVCVLTAYFFWQSHRQTVGIFRILGGTKRQAVSSLLLCAVALTVIGAATGAAVGSGAAYVVGSTMIQRNVAEIELDMSQDTDTSALTAQEAGIRITPELLPTLAAACAALLYPAFLLGFAATDINREPRELLPKGKG